MKYYLGVDIGGSKTHSLIVDENGQAVGFARGGPGNWEGVGYEGLTRVLVDTTNRALRMAGIDVREIAGAGMGIGGYDWPSQKQPHLDAIRPLGLACPLEIYNDAVLGIPVGAEGGWGVSVVAGTGCNCYGWTRDQKLMGRVVGGGSYWSGEYAGGGDIVARAMRAVAFEWTQRGPRTALTKIFLDHTHARNLSELVEGVYLNTYHQFYDHELVMQVFQAARDGDPEALNVVRWAGEELGMLAVGVINQLDLHFETFDVVLIGSLHDGHPLMSQMLEETVHKVAPKARMVRMKVPPVTGAALLGMKAAGVRYLDKRPSMVKSAEELIVKSRREWTTPLG